MHKDWEKVKEVLGKGRVAVVPTDTLYGIVAKAFDQKAVERIYDIKGRNEKKPLIVLISSFEDLKKFGIKLSIDEKKILESFWPGKVSVILRIGQTYAKKFQYLHRGTNSIAFRMIGERNKNLFNILKVVGPLVAPSANPEGKTPAHSRKSARAYFGKAIDAYVCTGNRFAKPSTLVTFEKDKIKILRQGSVKISPTTSPYGHSSSGRRR